MSDIKDLFLNGPAYEVHQNIYIYPSDTQIPELGSNISKYEDAPCFARFISREHEHVHIKRNCCCISTKFKYCYVKIEDTYSSKYSRGYLEDLYSNFELIENNPKTLYKDGYWYIEIDFTNLSGAILLGILNFYRVIEENPNIPIVYSYLKEIAPELNFYQRLIASHIIKRPSSVFNNIHGGISCGCVFTLGDLSLPNVINWWQKYRPSLKIPMSKTGNFSCEQSDLTPLERATTIDYGLNNSSQNQWLPKQWSIWGFPKYNKRYTVGGLNMSDKTIRYLLDINPEKQWVTYA